MIKYVIIAYQANKDTYHSGYLSSSYNSDFICEDDLTEEALIEEWGKILMLNESLEADYERQICEVLIFCDSKLVHDEINNTIQLDWHDNVEGQEIINKAKNKCQELVKKENRQRRAIEKEKQEKNRAKNAKARKTKEANAKDRRRLQYLKLKKEFVNNIKEG